MKVNEPSEPSRFLPGEAKEALRTKERPGGFLWRKPGAALRKKPPRKEPTLRQKRARELQVSGSRVGGAGCRAVTL